LSGARPGKMSRRAPLFPLFASSSWPTVLFPAWHRPRDKPLPLRVFFFFFLSPRAVLWCAALTSPSLAVARSPVSFADYEEWHASTCLLPGRRGRSKLAASAKCAGSLDCWTGLCRWPSWPLPGVISPSVGPSNRRPFWRGRATPALGSGTPHAFSPLIGAGPPDLTSGVAAAPSGALAGPAGLVPLCRAYPDFSGAVAVKPSDFGEGFIHHASLHPWAAWARVFALATTPWAHGSCLSAQAGD